MARLSDEEYLRTVEALAREIVERAHDEGWVSYDTESETATRLHRAVNKLARALRHEHYEGDGCLEH